MNLFKFLQRPAKRSKTVVALFNYGGGMRGLLPLHIMAEIERRTGRSLAEMVDVFCGPSTGALINAALNMPDPDNPSKPRFSAEDMIRFYETEGINIFPKDAYRSFRGFIHDFNNRTLKISQLNALLAQGHYNPAALRRSCARLYGLAKMNKALSGLVVPFFNIDSTHIPAMRDPDDSDDSPVHSRVSIADPGGHAVWLTHLPFLPERRNLTPDVRLYDAVLGSAAAPTYFPCHTVPVTWPETGEKKIYTGIDGNIFDNPCITYHGVLKHFFGPDTNFLMIVLGTGKTRKSIKGSDWNRFGALGVVDPMNDFPLIRIFFHASESALMESFVTEMRDQAFVFNRSLYDDLPAEARPSPAIDDASPENLKRIENFARFLLKENEERLDRLCEILAERV